MIAVIFFLRDLLQCALWPTARALHKPEHLRNTKDFLKFMGHSIALKLPVWADKKLLTFRKPESTSWCSLVCEKAIITTELLLDDTKERN